MKLSEVPMLLGFASFIDNRLSVDELRARAWFESLDEDLELDEAKRIVSAWYANHDGVISPSHLNREFRYRKASEVERARGEELSRQLEESKKNKASPEVVAKYMAEIRAHLNRGKDATVEIDSREMASDS
jgi:hypothetical protein